MEIPSVYLLVLALGYDEISGCQSPVWWGGGLFLTCGNVLSVQQLEPNPIGQNLSAGVTKILSKPHKTDIVCAVSSDSN